MNRSIIFLVVLFLCSPCMAGDESMFFYSRMKITLIPKPEPKITPEPLPEPKPRPLTPQVKNMRGELPTTKAEKKKEEEVDELRVRREPPEETPPPAPPPREPIEFTVDAKTPDHLDQEDVISQTTFNDREGLLIVIDPIGEASISATRMLSTADVIFINEDGYITRIAPKLNVAELKEPVSSGKPIKAILFIKASGVEKDRIVPGDKFEGTLFKTHPVIIQ